jgi:hypothetical protein
MNLAHLDELDRIELPDGFAWRPVRKHFGIQAFGVNAYTPGASGQVVEEHTEQTNQHEEIYVVLRGRVRFTVDGDEHELGPGQLVFVRDPSVRRSATRSRPGSTRSPPRHTSGKAATTRQDGCCRRGWKRSPGALRSSTTSHVSRHWPASGTRRSSC